MTEQHAAPHPDDGARWVAVEPEDDGAALGAALHRLADDVRGEGARSAGEPGGPLDVGGALLRDVVWAAYHGPASATVAVALLTSPRARGRLENAWAEACPSDEVLRATVARPGADADARFVAESTRRLVESLHAGTCAECRRRLRQHGGRGRAERPEGANVKHAAENTISTGGNDAVPRNGGTALAVPPALPARRPERGDAGA